MPAAKYSTPQHILLSTTNKYPRFHREMSLDRNSVIVHQKGWVLYPLALNERPSDSFADRGQEVDLLIVSTLAH